jgi:uncharacterized alpha-E superfamily protein
MESTVNGEAMAYPDVILPAQYASRNSRLTPERRLMIAVLDDAVHCVAKYRSATHGLGRRLFAEEIEWFLSEDTDWPYSFESICENLDLDARAVRAELLSEANSPPSIDRYAARLTSSG